MTRLILALALLLAAAPAHAHKLKLFVSQEGTEAVGSLYFAGGGKAAGLDGRVLDPDGKVVASLRTDAEGGFRFTPPDDRPYLIHFETADGHLAEARLGGNAAPPAAATVSTAAADTAQIEAALARQLTPLRQQIDALDSRARLSDIVGGIGLIVGLFGISAWIVSRRKDGSS